MITDGTLNVKRYSDLYQEQLSNLSDKTGKALPMALSLHRGHNKYSFSPIEYVKKVHGESEIPVYRVVLENTAGRQYEIICTEDTEFGVLCFDKPERTFENMRKYYRFVKLQYLNKSTVCVDESDLVCQVMSVERVKTPNVMYDVRVMYNNNLFFNGVLIR